MSKRTPTGSKTSTGTTSESGKRKLESWIESFVNQTANLHSPPIFRKWTAINTIASTLEQKVWLQTSRPLYPNLYTFLVAHPGIHVDLVLSNALVDLREARIDVALRIAVLPDSGLTAVPVGQMRAVVVASPAYLKQHGVPHHPADLKDHRAIGFTIEGQDRSGWAFGSSRSTAAPQERLVVNANDVKVAAAVAGQGLARALAYQVTDEVRDGRLRVVLQAHEPPPVPVHLVYPAGRVAAAKVREFVHLAAERLRALPVLQGRGLEAPRRRSLG